MGKGSFAAFAREHIPNNVELPKREKPPEKVLPHGFKVGQRVYYLDDFEEDEGGNPLRMYGTVIDTPSSATPFERDMLWASWDDADDAAWMDPDDVYRA